MKTKSTTRSKMTADDGRKFSYRVYKAVALYRGIPLTDDVMDDIDALDKEEVVAAFLAWEGIIGYTSAIMSIIKA